jgi:chymotrypsin
MFLKEEITLNQFVQPIVLPSGADLNDNFAGAEAILSGWGRFSSEPATSEVLRFVRTSIITNTACRIRFPGIISDSISKYCETKKLGISLTVNFLLEVCSAGSGSAGNIGACNGDSGGPLTIQRNGQSVLIGIASFVSTAGCEAGWPTGFSRVTSFAAWFRARM